MSAEKTQRALSQIAYLVLGLALFQVFEFPVIYPGWGAQLCARTRFWVPAWGFFIPAGWLCGYLAFRDPPKLENLAFSGLCGLGVIHGMGVVYLTIATLFGWLQDVSMSYWELLVRYSIWPIPGHLVVVCAVAVLSLTLRQLLFY